MSPQTKTLHKYPHYYPFGLMMSGRSWSEGYRYGFNGKELDAEGMGGNGSTYDYGFRIYNPAIAKFLSVDPLAVKHYDKSPYLFVGNSPIVHIDTDGRDYEIYIDHNTKTIIIKASVRTISNDVDAKSLALHNADYFNGQSHQFKYVVGKGVDMVVYNVQFEITFVETEFEGLSYKSGHAPSVLNSIKLVDKEVLENLGTIDGKAEGVNLHDIQYITKEQKGTSRGEQIASHELGHGLGIVHSAYGLMTSIGSGWVLSPANIISILGRAGFGEKANYKNDPNYEYLGRATKVKEIGSNPDFNSGTAVTAGKANRMQKRAERKIINK